MFRAYKRCRLLEGADLAGAWPPLLFFSFLSYLSGQWSGGGPSAAVSPEKAEKRRSGGEAPAGRVSARRPLVPKSVERILKLVAMTPYQPVRRPAGNQPVVVLNHPDADLPEVARIMKVINRYKGAVRKVALSRTTLDALAGAAGGPPRWEGGAGGCVQERFLLKLKLRRLSRKKYQVVGGPAPSRLPAVGFCCWFCGRVFTSQEMWVIHRQRHLVEWK